MRPDGRYLPKPGYYEIALWWLRIGLEIKL